MADKFSSEEQIQVARALFTVARDPHLLEIARKAIEDQLIELRDERISAFMRNNGLVVKEVDGRASDVIRMGPEHAMETGLKAIARFLSGPEQ